MIRYKSNVKRRCQQNKGKSSLSLLLRLAKYRVKQRSYRTWSNEVESEISSACEDEAEVQGERAEGQKRKASGQQCYGSW